MESGFRQVQIFPFHGHAPFQATPLEKHIIFTNKRHQRLLWPHSPETQELDILIPVKQQLKNLCNSVTNHRAQSIRTLYTNMSLIIIIIIVASSSSSSSSSNSNVVSNYYTIRSARTNKN
jgi:hypothetical protein